MYKKILVAVDGSENSNRAISKAIEFKKIDDSEIVVFHSIKHHWIDQSLNIPIGVFSTFGYRIPQVDYNKIVDEYTENGKKVLNNAKEQFAKENVSVETRLISDEEPVDYIKKIVKKEKFDLVLVGCKGHHSKLKTTLVGSVPEKTLNKADCDVLVVR